MKRRAWLTTLSALAPIALDAQTSAPQTMEACYVPASGTTYRINTTQSPAPGAPSACVNPTHVKFGWNQQGPAGPTGATGPAGPEGPAGPAGSAATFPRTAWDALQLDDVNGFSAKGSIGSGASIGTGARGTTMLWYPARGAFRVGYSQGEWDEQDIGSTSVAMGLRTTASGSSAMAFGSFTTATGSAATALGTSTLASGWMSLASGYRSEARGYASVAMGDYAKALGTTAIALGSNVNAAHSGTFVFGDSYLRSTPVTPDQPNQFLVRAGGGAVFQVNQSGTVGCYLTTSSGGWQCTSDRNEKDDFAAVDGENVLGSLRELPIATWRYRSDSTRTTHIGPTAQDFRAAFAVGRDSVSIGVVDAQGVALAAAKALEERTRTQGEEIVALRAQLAAMAARLKQLEGRTTP